jgi:hypothetical protein
VFTDTHEIDVRKVNTPFLGNFKFMYDIITFAFCSFPAAISSTRTVTHSKADRPLLQIDPWGFCHFVTAVTPQRYRCWAREGELGVKTG